MKRDSVLVLCQLLLIQLRCGAPAVSQVTVHLHLDLVQGHSEPPKTLSLQLSFLSVGQPPGQLCTQSQTVHASHVWTSLQAALWEGQYLPQCIAPKHRVQSRSSSCCNTKKNTILFTFGHFQWTSRPISSVTATNTQDYFANNNFIWQHNVRFVVFWLLKKCFWLQILRENNHLSIGIKHYNDVELYGLKLLGAHLKQIRIQHQPCDSHFGCFLHLGTYNSADDPFCMDCSTSDRHSGRLPIKYPRKHV